MATSNQPPADQVHPVPEEQLEVTVRIPDLPPRRLLSDDEIKRRSRLYNGLHALIGAAILNVLVFLQISAGRSNSNTARTTFDLVKLLVFGIVFICYSVVKGIELAIPWTMHELKKFFNETSILFGICCFGSIVWIFSDDFAKYGFLPSLGIIVIIRAAVYFDAIARLDNKRYQLRVQKHRHQESEVFTAEVANAIHEFNAARSALDGSDAAIHAHALAQQGLIKLDET